MDEALSLLRPAARGQIGVEHTSATLHSLLFTGHAHALAGRPALALEAFDRHTAEVERRQVSRFAGRGVNFAGWVLRNLGSRQEALDHHYEALDVAQHHQSPEGVIAALEDLAEDCLDAGEADAAQSRLAQARLLLRGDLVFGWRLELKHRLISGRLALVRGEAEQALAEATALESQAAVLGIPRYVSVARLLRHRAHRALGVAVDLGVVAADLDLLDSSVAIEAWWWTGDVAADFAHPGWLDRAVNAAGRLCRNAGGYAGGLQRAADKRLGAWRAAAG
jgi:tetratricopeptide (TPR) repeat protein